MAITAIVAAAEMGTFEFYFYTYVANNEFGMTLSGSPKRQTDN